jgi:iron complex outermembrane recepter protein
MNTTVSPVSVSVGRCIGKSRCSFSTATALGTLLAISTTGFAAQPTATDDGALEEVIVTAQFREQNLQDTGIAITAVTGEKLEEQGLKNVQDLGLVIPNASIRQQGSFSGPTPQIGMRGVSTAEFIFTSDPGVGVYIDDIYQGSLTGSAMDLLDLERVEVLRGPQGTLFGKNSLGGAIRLLSKQPRGDNSGSLEMTYGTSNRLDLRGSYDFAVTDRLFARVTGVSKQIDGYGDVLDFTCQMRVNGTPALSGTFPTLVPSDRQSRNNCKIGERGGGETNAGRLMLRFLASEDVELSLAADYSSSVAEPSVDAKLSRHQPSNFFNNLYSNTVVFPRYGIRFTTDDRFLTGDPYKTYANPIDPIGGKNFPPLWYSDVWGASAKLGWSINDALRLDLIVGYRDYQIDWMADGDQMPIDLNHTYVLQGHDQTSYEARLSGGLFDKKLTWTAGFYRYEDYSHLGGYVTLPAFAAILPNFNQNDTFTSESNSAFLHTEFTFTDKFSMTAGGRFTDESKVYQFDHSPYLLVSTPLNYGSSHFDWKVGGNYRISDSMMAYASAATGFRSDGAQPRPFTPGQQKEVVPAEELISYEIGLKSDFLDNRLRLNLAAFFDDYDPRVVVSAGTQCNFPANPDPGPVFRGLTGSLCPAGTEVGNSATPTGSPWFAYASAPGSNRGVELEATASPVQGLNMNATLAWYDFKSEADRTLPNGQPNNVYVDPSFDVQAQWSGSLGAEYRFTAGAGSLTPRIDWFYQGSRSNGIAYLPQLPGSANTVPGYSLVNARITYTSEDDAWLLALSAENLLDKFYWYQLGPERSNLDNSPADNRTGSPARGREIALTFRRNFQ